MPATRNPAQPRLRVLYLVEGYTDIRFVNGLAEITDLTIIVPRRHYRDSALRERIADSGCRVVVYEIGGGRLAFQFRSLATLLRRAPGFDVILAQEVLRGALSANLAGALKGIPVVTYMGTDTLEYFRCRYQRLQISRVKAIVGEAVIRSLLTINGRLASRCLAMGPYLRDKALRYCPRSGVGLYYGIDTNFFRPASARERGDLRRRLNLPTSSFLIFFSSRISHEKDPETVLRAAALARENGLNAVVINLGGGYREFTALATKLAIPNHEQWVIGRPAVNPSTEVNDYFRVADALVQASLAEGAAFSTLEALACGTPVIATAVGGMAVQLDGYARLVPRRDADAMAREIMWVASNPDEARAQALAGREYVVREWTREKAFEDLLKILIDVSSARKFA